LVWLNISGARLSNGAHRGCKADGLDIDIHGAATEMEIGTA
jgi:hypothetical protein